MELRGVTVAEVRETLRDGWPAGDAAPGREGSTLVFAFNATREGKSYAEKEVSVYWKVEDDVLIVLTVKSRYGKGFPRG